jgi:hypothetical protein
MIILLFLGIKSFIDLPHKVTEYVKFESYRPNFWESSGTPWPDVCAQPILYNVLSGTC